MAQKNVYNEIPGNSEEKSMIAGNVSAQSSTPEENSILNTPPSSTAAGGTNVIQRGKKKVKEINFKNLEGDVELIPSLKNFRIMAGMTVRIQGVGKFLSGFYYVMNRSINISGSSVMTIKISVIKTNFGDSLKGEPPIVIEEEDLIGDKEKQSKSKTSEAFDLQGNYDYSEEYGGGDEESSYSEDVSSGSYSEGDDRVYTDYGN